MINPEKLKEIKTKALSQKDFYLVEIIEFQLEMYKKFGVMQVLNYENPEYHKTLVNNEIILGHLNNKYQNILKEIENDKYNIGFVSDTLSEEFFKSKNLKKISMAQSEMVDIEAFNYEGMKTKNITYCSVVLIHIGKKIVFSHVNGGDIESCVSLNSILKTLTSPEKLSADIVIYSPENYNYRPKHTDFWLVNYNDEKGFYYSEEGYLPASYSNAQQFFKDNGFQEENIKFYFSLESNTTFSFLVDKESKSVVFGVAPSS